MLHVTRAGDQPEEEVKTHLTNLLHSRFEVRPNAILFHTGEQLRVLQKVGVALKEQKVVDNRPKPAPPNSPTATTSPLKP